MFVTDGELSEEISRHVVTQDRHCAMKILHMFSELRVEFQQVERLDPRLEDRNSGLSSKKTSTSDSSDLGLAVI